MKTLVKHSSSKFAWNVINTALGGKYKIAIVPYVGVDMDDENEPQRVEAFKHAQLISKSFNSSIKMTKTDMVTTLEGILDFLVFLDAVESLTDEDLSLKAEIQEYLKN